MKELRCPSCGSIDLRKENNAYICNHCGMRLLITKEDGLSVSSSIELNEDVARLLKQWDADPTNGKKYAQLILQIDASNEKAKRELQKLAVNNQSGCYIATAVYGSYDCPQVWVLRRYRDYALSKSVCGRLFIRVYYRVSPHLVKLFGKDEWFLSIWRKSLDIFVNNLEQKGYKSTPYRDNEV